MLMPRCPHNFGNVVYVGQEKACLLRLMTMHHQFSLSSEFVFQHVFRQHILYFQFSDTVSGLENNMDLITLNKATFQNDSECV
jgi:hypothetical protein